MSTLFPIETLEGDPGTRWFSGHGCVVHGAETVSVFVGGSLIGSYEPGDRGARNLILVGLAADDGVHLGKLAAAFDVVPETLRLVRAQAKAEGLKAILERAPGNKESKVTPAMRRRLEKMFEQGLSITQAHERITKRHKVSRSLVGNVRMAWSIARADARNPSGAPPRTPRGALRPATPTRGVPLDPSRRRRFAPIDVAAA